jgi:hypothetical protein
VEPPPLKPSPFSPGRAGSRTHPSSLDELANRLPSYARSDAGRIVEPPPGLARLLGAGRSPGCWKPNPVHVPVQGSGPLSRATSVRLIREAAPAASLSTQDTWASVRGDGTCWPRVQSRNLRQSRSIRERAGRLPAAFQQQERDAARRHDGSGPPRFFERPTRDPASARYLRSEQAVRKSTPALERWCVGNCLRIARMETSAA